MSFIYFEEGSFMKRKTFEQKREEIKKLTETMNESIEFYYETPEQMAEHLKFMMQFYYYSLRNTALIQSQFNGAQAVGSYKFWQEKGFQVQKGEKAIQILVPNKIQPKFKGDDGKWKGIKYATAQEKERMKSGELEKKEGKMYLEKEVCLIYRKRMQKQVIYRTSFQTNGWKVTLLTIKRC